MPKITLTKEEINFMVIFIEGALITLSKSDPFLQKYNIPHLKSIQEKLERAKK